MKSIIEKAIELRKAGKHDESRSLLAALLSDREYGAKAHLQIAWPYDNESKEQEAIFHYESALNGSLSDVERFDALFDLASTFRSLVDMKMLSNILKKHCLSIPIQLKLIHSMQGVCII